MNNQCQLCLSYISEIKQMSEQIKVKSILLNEQEKNYKEQIEGLQRQIDALKNLLTSKGILLNEGEEKGLKDYPHSVVWENDYDYAADDRNFDERRGKRLK